MDSFDQEDLNIEWDTSSVPNGAYTLYAQSTNIDGKSGPTEEISFTVDKSKETKLTFNHDDHLTTNLQYPHDPVAEIVMLSDGDVIGNTDFVYDPPESEAYCNDHTHWAKVEYRNDILHIRGKSYDPKPYGYSTDIHVWIKDSTGTTVLDTTIEDTEMYSEGDWTTGEQLLHDRAGGLYYMPSSFDKEFLWSSNNNWNGQEDVMDEFNEGAGFIFFSGHGSPRSWGNHYPGIPGNRKEADVDGLNVVDLHGPPFFPMEKLQNDYENPVVVVGGCHNSMFTVSLITTWLDKDNSNNMHCYGVPTPETWSWALTKQSKHGAIATIGNTGYGYGILGEWCTTGGLDNWITTEFFLQYGTNGQDILGDAHAQAITSYIEEFGKSDDGHMKSMQQWVLLGDPSLKMGGYPPQQQVEIGVRGIPGYMPGDTIKLDAEGAGSSYDWSIDKDGDGTFDTFTTGQTIQEQWDSPGVYWVKAESSSGVTGLTVVEIENEEPNTPIIDGPTELESGQTYTYTISGSDPNGDELYYLVDWGDGKTDVITPGSSNTISHRFTKTGPSKITVNAIDSYGQYTEGSLSISVPKGSQRPIERPFMQLINNLLERFPNLFPLLRQIFEMVY